MRRHLLSTTVMIIMALSALMAPLGVWANPLAQMEVLAVMSGQDPVAVAAMVTKHDSLDIFASNAFGTTTVPGYMQTAQPEVSAIYLGDAFATLIEQDRTGRRLTMYEQIDFNGHGSTAAQGVGAPNAGHRFEPSGADIDTKTSDDRSQSLFDDYAEHPRNAAWEVGAVYIGNTEPAGSLIGS